MVSVVVDSEESARTAGLLIAFLSQSLNSAITLDLIVAKDGEFHFFSLVLLFLWLSVDLFFTLFTTTSETKDKVKGGFLLDVIICKSAAIFKLLTSEDEALLIRGNSFLILDFLLHGVNSIAAINIKRDGLPREGLDEYLH
eukprot:CAMPEP_0184485360 /NCGR_PEP_ID=MMETSP0113_2-20130426/6979_1 /TAXON_ID=91329 /ORGANISM="Norrisiella sphaerica, Strain BC52" /LENGTH=140 /DNA_ID=CAMNT_0026866775 /DNA_START=128 /DNA_END=547 /DNA_ORIENTATION=+